LSCCCGCVIVVELVELPLSKFILDGSNSTGELLELELLELEELSVAFILLDHLDP